MSALGGKRTLGGGEVVAWLRTEKFTVEDKIFPLTRVLNILQTQLVRVVNPHVVLKDTRRCLNLDAMNAPIED